MKKQNIRRTGAARRRIVRNMKNMRERRMLAVEKSANRTVQTCLKGY